MHRLHTLPHDEARLRRVAKKVKNPQHPSVRMLADEMIRIAEAWEISTGGRCEGLAAPQIGVNLQVIILRKTDFVPPRDPGEFNYPAYTGPTETVGNYVVPIINDEYKQYREERDAAVIRWGDVRSAFQQFQKDHPNYCNWHIGINPRFRMSEGVQESIEGCLSVPGKLGKVVRPNVVIFDYVDERGIRVGPFRTKDQLSAACITHEIDHLKGNLYCDNALVFMDTDKFKEFIEQEAREKAEATTVVEGEDAARLSEMIENPPEPTPALKELLSEEAASAEG